MKVVSWGDFRRSAPELAAHVEERLGAGRICYLATVRSDEWPRVHPVGVNFRGEQMVVVMYPTSPKGHDIVANGRYAVHGTVEDTKGGGGEALVTGTATTTDPTPADLGQGWVAFELQVGEVLATRYGPNDLKPVSTRWKAN